ncbi:site-2 protease family protein [Candidatus Woesearchaeota archaeon]|nr:site-2 protease family protein [Candidatus Woesearchaeota archaeon]
MALDFLSGLADFALRYRFVLGFYIVIALLVFVYRKKFQFQLKVIALLRTNLGLGLMDRIATKHRELVRLLGYIGIGVGFLSMAFIIFILGQSVYTLLTVPDSPSPLSPVLPGVRIPGVPESFFVPFVHGIIAIFIVAVVHEFAHGVVARAHNVAIKSSGPAIIGPIFAAFVEPDEAQLKKKGDVVNYSIFAAGTFSNLLLSVVVLLFVSLVFTPLAGLTLEKQGVVITKVTPGAPAYLAGIPPGSLVISVNGNSVVSRDDVLSQLALTKPNETVVFSNGTAEFAAVSTVHPAVEGRGYFGIEVAQYYNPRTAAFKVVFWFAELFRWIATLGFGIGIANMIPVGPLDGGKMLHLAWMRIVGEKKATRAFMRFSILLLLVILFLLSPIFRAMLKAIF